MTNVNRGIFFAVCAVIFAVAALTAISGSPPVKIDSDDWLATAINLWREFSWLQRGAAAGFTAVAVFIVLFSTWLWRWPLFHPWLVKERDLTGTWLMESNPGNEWDPFRTLMQIDHGFFSIHVRLVRELSLAASSTAALVPGEKAADLYFTYDSAVIGVGEKHSHDHYGTVRLTLHDAEQGRWRPGWAPSDRMRLVGEYFTNKPHASNEEKDGRLIMHRGTWGRTNARWHRRAWLNDKDAAGRNWLNTLPAFGAGVAPPRAAGEPEKDPVEADI